MTNKHLKKKFLHRQEDEMIVLDKFAKDLKKMREHASNNTEFSVRLRNLLYDKALIERSEIQLNKLKEFKKLIDLLETDSVTLGQSVEAWTHFLNNNSVDNEDALRKRIFTKISLLSNILDPKFQGKSLSPELIAASKITMMILLKSKDDYKVFINYLKGQEIFSEECLMEQDALTMWDTIEGIAPILSPLAQVISSLPASTFFKQIRPESNELLHNEKFMFVNEMLR